MVFDEIVVGKGRYAKRIYSLPFARPFVYNKILINNLQLIFKITVKRLQRKKFRDIVIWL